MVYIVRFLKKTGRGFFVVVFLKDVKGLKGQDEITYCDVLLATVLMEAGDVLQPIL